MKIVLIAMNPGTGEARVIEADGVDEETAKAQVPDGWRVVSIRRI